MSIYANDPDRASIYQGWPTERLLQAIAKSADYTPEAIALLRAELARRNVPDTTVTAPIEAATNREPTVNVQETFAERRRSLFGNRFGACIVDLVLSYSILIAADFTLGNRLYDRTLALWLGLFAAYYIVAEGRFGATPGKKLVGLKVVTTSLGRCGYGQAMVRFVLRVIECFFVPVIGVIAFFRTERCQRLGDLIAGTLVVRTEDLTTPAKAPKAS